MKDMKELGFVIEYVRVCWVLEIVRVNLGRSKFGRFRNSKDGWVVVVDERGRGGRRLVVVFRFYFVERELGFILRIKGGFWRV